MEKENKIRIVCMNCLYSKILPVHKSDLKYTRLITSDTCEKCNSDISDNGLMYFDVNMMDLNSIHPDDYK